MHRWPLILLLGVLSFGRPAQATVYRLLSGDATTINSDWSADESTNAFDVVQNGSPLKPAVTTEHFTGSKGIAFQVLTSTVTERVEYKLLKATDTNGLHLDNGRYCGFAFKLATNNAPFTNSCLIWQGWQGAPWGPPAMLKFASDSSPPYRIRLNIRNMTTGPDSATPDQELWSASIIQPGVWYPVVVYVAPRLGNTGNIKLWINGTSYVNWTGQIGYDPAQVTNTYSGLDLKNGIYQPGGNNGRVLYFDDMRVASTFAEASPVAYAQKPQVAQCVVSNQTWSMSVTGNPGALFTVESSTNLVQWSPLLATNPPALPYRFTNFAGPTRKFYRVTSEP